MYVQDPQFHNIRFCRSLDYYVDPSSEKVLELGTKAFPFKKIGLVFLEILNLSSHSDRNITINLKESTTNEMMALQAYIINVTNVEIRSYSDSAFAPRPANIFVSDFAVPYFTSKTRFNIVKEPTLKLAENVNKPGYSPEEKGIEVLINVGIVVNRANFRMSNIHVSRDVVAGKGWPTQFLRPVYVQGKYLVSNYSRAEHHS